MRKRKPMNPIGSTGCPSGGTSSRYMKPQGTLGTKVPMDFCVKEMLRRCQSRVMLVQDLCQGSERRIVAIAARHIGQVVRQIDPKLILPLFVHGHLHRLTYGHRAP